MTENEKKFLHEIVQNRTMEMHSPWWWNAFSSKFLSANLGSAGRDVYFVEENGIEHFIYVHFQIGAGHMIWAIVVG